MATMHLHLVVKLTGFKQYYENVTSRLLKWFYYNLWRELYFVFVAFYDCITDQHNLP